MVTTTPAQLMTASLLEVFGERDPARRRAGATWTFGPPAGPVAVRGMDIGIMADARITTLHTIIEPAP
jgi:hypothetical protein